MKNVLKLIIMLCVFYCSLFSLQVAQAGIAAGIHLGDLKRNTDETWQWPADWQQYDAEVKSPSEYYWLKVAVPKDLKNHEILFFKTRNHEVEVYAADKLIYSYGLLQERNDLLGSNWHLVDLPPETAGREVFLRVYGNYSRDRMILGDLQIAAEREIYMRLLRNNLDYFFSASLGVAMFLIMLVSWLLADEVIYLRTAVYFFFFVLWTIGESGFNLLLWNDPPAWMRLVLYCAYLLPIVFSLMMREFISQPFYRWERRMRRILCFFGASAVLVDIFKPGFLRDALDFYFLLVIAGIGIWLTSLMRLMRSGNREARWIMCGMIPMPLLVIYDMAGVHWRVVPWNHHLTHLGGVCLAVALMVIFSRRVAERGRLKEMNELLVDRVKTATRLSLTDPLTGLYNRAKFTQAMDAVKYGNRAALIMFDVDHFKNINDAYGHDAGDRVLVELAELAAVTVSGRGLLARLGGEEFAVLCKNTELDQAVALAERLRSVIEARFSVSAQTVTCSFGVSYWQQGDSAERFSKRADQALYAAKAKGRNCVCIESLKLIQEKSS